MRTSEIRQRFVDFYEAEGYHLLPRAPMLDNSIPMSFVMSAGLVQIERSLARTQTRNGNKFMLVQDCFRHFDLDRVGTDDFHLSIFEMLGAFKLGPINKVDTIQRMWRLATTILKIDKERIWASYFRGEEVLQNHRMLEDQVAHQAWINVGLPPERIVGLGAKDNFWLQGKGFDGRDSIRKGGTNTELFYDRGHDRACGQGCLPGCRCGRFIEFSNSLFISYEVDAARGTLEVLVDPFSETVIGVERVAMILQACESVFEIDSYQPIMREIRKHIHADQANRFWVAESERVLADYLKGLYLLVADSAPPPGKNGRERIIKQLIRGVMTRQLLLGISSSNFVPAILCCLAEGIDDTRARPWVRERVLAYFSTQREKFNSTVERGYSALERNLEDNRGKTLSGEQIVQLEKSIGIPRLLVEKKLISKNLIYNRTAYEDALTHWKRQILSQ